MLNALENLIKLARDRKSSPVEGSYTNKLLTDKSLSKAKVLEEIKELIEAVEENSNKIHEAADVFYHLLMYLEANNIKIEEVMSELEKRKKWVTTRIIFLQKFYAEKFLAIKFMRMILFCHFTISIHKKKIHALVIPKGKYIDLDDFSLNATSDEMVGLLKGINIVLKS